MPMPKKYTVEFLNGKKYNGLTFIKEVNRLGRAHRSLWKCDCGNEYEATTGEVVQGTVKSCKCGIYRKKTHHHLWSGFEDLTGTMWGHYRDGAKLRKIKFDVSKEYVWKKFIEQNKCCALSGVELTMPNKYNDRSRTASLDRIDSSKGYIEGNVQWVHKDINFMKQELSDEKFIDWCKKVSNNNA